MSRLRDRLAELENVESDLLAARRRIGRLEQEVALEMTKRVSAQRGLVAYMREHGLGDRIGYDPDADPKVAETLGAAYARSQAARDRLKQLEPVR